MEVPPFEFQVRLTPEEYEELMERRKAAGDRGLIRTLNLTLDSDIKP